MREESEKASAAEKSIVSRVLAGDKEHFQLLVLAHQERVFAVIMRALGDEAKAKELTQETFIKAYLNLGRFRFDSSFSTWLIRIALNLTSSYFSSREYRERIKTSSLDESNCLENMSHGSSDVLDEQAVLRLQKLMGRLSEKLRLVFIMCALDQLSYQEAANILGIPVGTVRSRLNKARLTIRQWYFEA